MRTAGVNKQIYINIFSFILEVENFEEERMKEARALRLSVCRVVTLQYNVLGYISHAVYLPTLTDIFGIYFTTSFRRVILYTKSAHRYYAACVYNVYIYIHMYTRTPRRSPPSFFSSWNAFFSFEAIASWLHRKKPMVCSQRKRRATIRHLLYLHVYRGKSGHEKRRRTRTRREWLVLKEKDDGENR